MSELITGLLDVAGMVFRAIQAAVAGDRKGALEQALLASRALNDALAKEVLK